MSIQFLPQIQHTRSIHFAEVLMARESITPVDAGCQTYLMHRLKKLGFVCEKHNVNGVKISLLDGVMALVILLFPATPMSFLQGRLINGNPHHFALLLAKTNCTVGAPRI
jgi:acetylornithine deacetylase/succinyl-diaminopimelate desuccinylase-like protein